MAIHNGKVSFPTDSPYSKEFHALIMSLIVVDASDRPFIDEVIIKTSGLLKSTLGVEVADEDFRSSIRSSSESNNKKKRGHSKK